MIREVYHFLNIVLVLMLGILFCGFQSVFLKLNVLGWLHLDFLLLLVIYIAQFRGLFEGSVLVILVARFAEIHSVALNGMLLSCYLVTYLVVYFTKELMLVGSSFSNMMLVVGAGIVWKITFLVLSHYFGFFDNVWLTLFEHIVPYCIGLVVVSRLVFGLLEKMDELTHYGQTHGEN